MNEKLLSDRSFNAPVQTLRDELTLFRPDAEDGATQAETPGATVAEKQADEVPRLTLVFPDDQEEDTGCVEPRTLEVLAPPPAAAKDSIQEEPSLAGTIPWTSAEEAGALFFACRRDAAEQPLFSGQRAAAGNGPITAEEHPHFAGDHSAVEEIALHNPLTDESLETAAAAIFGDDIRKTAAHVDQPLELIVAASAPDESVTAEIAADDDALQDDEPILEITLVDPLPADVEIPAEPDPAIRSVQSPPRIGSGRLVPAKLTWKPGDPFATMSPRPRFRWERMLTTACATAACGMMGIWLLRTVLA